MTPNQILKQTRRDREMTLDQMADDLGVSTQRVSQMERGDPIPIDRIRAWAGNPKLPDWVRHMAKLMWLATLEQQHASIGAQLEQLGQTIAEDLVTVAASPRIN